MPNEEPIVINVGHNAGENTMAGENAKNTKSASESIFEQNMAQIGQSGAIAQNNFITTTKAQDYDYLEGKRIVSLEEAVGVREVAAQTTPGGPKPAS